MAHHRSWEGDGGRGVAEALPRREEGAGRRETGYGGWRGEERSTLFGVEKERRGGVAEALPRRREEQVRREEEGSTEMKTATPRVEREKKWTRVSVRREWKRR